jgi:4,5-DOPA dioxygenase extradiol
VEANTKLKNLIDSGNHQTIIQYRNLGKSLELSVPTPEHFLPLIYTLGLKQENDVVSFFNDKTIMGSISMTSVKIG